MSQSAVSRQVSALEKELKISLFHRHARGLVLTEQGEMLFGTASEIMGKLSTAETLLTDTTTKPSGDLRVTAPTGLGHGVGHAAAARVLRALSRHPRRAGAERRADRHRHARGRRRHLDQRAAAERPDPPAAVHDEDRTPTRRRSTSAATARRRSIADLDDHPIVSYSGTPAMHLSAIRWLETRRARRQAAAQAGVRRQQRAGDEVRDPGRHRGRAHPRLPDGRGKRAGAGAARTRSCRRCRSTSSIPRSSRPPRRSRCSGISWSPKRASGNSEQIARAL